MKSFLQPYPRYAPHFYYIFLLIALLQGVIWWQGRELRPDVEVVPMLPSQDAIQAFALGDEQSYFRMMAFELQHLGDGVGRVTPLYRYNYALLKEWGFVLDRLDARSHFVPAVMSFYYSHTQFTPDLRHVIDYLDIHTEHQINEKWEWIAEAVYLANHKLEDKTLALRLAERLARSTNPDTPMWALQMPAFIHEQRGELEEARVIIQDLMRREHALSERERSFMHYYIKHRLGMLDTAP